MSDSGYTPSTFEVRVAIEMAYQERKAGTTPNEFDRWLAAHDAVIREDQAKKDAAWREVAEIVLAKVKVHDQLALDFIDSVLRVSQSFTGTESE